MEQNLFQKKTTRNFPEDVLWELKYNNKLCHYAHDNLRNCQDRNDNSYECLNEMYAYDTYCPPDFIKQKKILAILEAKTQIIFTPDELKLMNHMRNSVYQSKLDGTIDYNK